MSTKSVSVSRVIAASPESLFAVVADASLHSVIDGSGTVRGTKGVAEPLHLGSRFRMNMRIGVPYAITNTVVEYDPPKRIAWEHLGKHVWRYEFEAIDENTTNVTETFDWTNARSPRYIELMRFPTKHLAGMEKTLERLEAFVTHRTHAL